MSKSINIDNIKNMEEEVQLDVEDIGEEYVIISKDTNDILNDMDFVDEDERFLCESIITNLEKYAAASIRDMKIVSLPFIGCIRINPIKRKLRDAKLHLSLIRKNMSKADYKKYVKDIIDEFGEEMSKADTEKLIMTRIRSNNKKRYDEYYKKLGRAYAEMFIYSIRLFKEVPFDIEWEEYYQKLKGENKVVEEVIDENDIKDYIAAQPRYCFK